MARLKIGGIEVDVSIRFGRPVGIYTNLYVRMQDCGASHPPGFILRRQLWLMDFYARVTWPSVMRSPVQMFVGLDGEIYRLDDIKTLTSQERAALFGYDPLQGVPA